jgi:GNAT superfamily N-acetyltransferase
MNAIDLDHAPAVRTFAEEVRLVGHGTSPSPAVYPAHLATDLELRDGSGIHLRPVRTADQPALLALFAGLSQQSRVFRFFTGAADLKGAAQLMVDVDYLRRYGVVATRGRAEGLLAHATYMASSGGRAEVAFVVADELQGLGLATLMLGHLAEVARENGIGVFFADVLPRNHHMIEVFEDSGFPVQTRFGKDAIRIEFQTALSPTVAESFARRDRSRTR